MDRRHTILRDNVEVDVESYRRRIWLGCRLPVSLEVGLSSLEFVVGHCRSTLSGSRLCGDSGYAQGKESKSSEEHRCQHCKIKHEKRGSWGRTSLDQRYFYTLNCPTCPGKDLLELVKL
jgi:hypothetical protein